MDAETAIEPRPAAERTHGFEFTGSGSEYFRIWIVNILLTILTLGIYSAWATVRTKRYFYGNTRLMGSGFEYHASPVTILKGRLIAVAALAILVGLGTVNPGLQMLAIFAALPFVPFLIVRSRLFNAVNSSWRNVRFDFDRRYGQAYAVYLLWPLLIPFTLGLIAPFVSYERNRFLVENSALGRNSFAFHSTVGGFYARLLGMFFLGVAVVIAMFALMAGVLSGMSVASAGAGAEAAEPSGALRTTAWVMMILFYVAIGAVAIAARVLILNYVWSGVGLRDGRVTSRLGVFRMIWITLSNILLIALTLGLYTPWARTRVARYRTARTRVTVDEETVSELTAAEQQQASAIGDEAIDVFGVEVGAI